MDILKAAGGILFSHQKSPRSILLIMRNGVWDLPKGKLEEDETIEECAAREVAEEVGVPLPEIIKYLCETYHEYEMNGTKVGKKTYWYAMATDQTEGLSPQREEGISDLRWVHAERALEMVGYKNLVKVIESYLGKK